MTGGRSGLLLNKSVFNIKGLLNGPVSNWHHHCFYLRRDEANKTFYSNLFIGDSLL